MKYVFSLTILLLVFAIATAAQSESALTNATPSPKGSSTVGDPANQSSLEIPPEKLRPVTIPKVEAGLTIDGKIDEEVWKSAAVLKDFYQTAPGNNTPPSKPTEVLLMYDERHLYIAFRCWDEKDKIRATVASRDGVFGEDNVRVWLDTYDDQRRAYVLGFNPFGIQQDGIFTEGNQQGADFSVDIVMESKGVIEDWGWSVEVKVPFKSLRYTAGQGKHWGFNAARNIDRFNDELDHWMPDDRNVSGFLIKAGKITGLEGIKYEKTLEVVPSITLSETGSRVRIFPTTPGNSDRFVNGPLKQDIGVTVKYSLSPNITIDAAYNPDFAEIEADAPVVTANQRFPIFFEEKRPFFLEGSEIFESPLRVFNSRAVVDPDVAAKITGKTGKISFGFLTALDKAPGNFSVDERNNMDLRPAITEFLDERAIFGVLRVKRDIGRENSIGAFATYRSFVEQKNLLAGVDGRFKLSPRMTTQFQFVGTSSRRCFFDPTFEATLNPGQAQRNREICGTGTFDPKLSAEDLIGNRSTYREYRTGNGVAYSANLDYTTDTHGWFVDVGGRSKDYRADAGFTRRVNTNYAFFFHRLSTKSRPNAKVIRASWNQRAGIDFDWDGRLQSFNLETGVELNLPRSTSVEFEVGTAYEKLYEEEFGLKRSPTRPLGTFFGAPTRGVWSQFASMEMEQSPSEQISYGFFVGSIRNAFDFFYFEPNGLQNPGPGFQFDAEAFLEYKPMDPLRISASYRKSRLVRNNNKVRSFDSDIVSIRSTYQFTRFIYTRLRLDYDGESRNTRGQLLFGWTPSPGKALYVGYNDDFNYNGFNPYAGHKEPGFARNGRTFFIRLSYLFRKSFG